MIARVAMLRLLSVMRFSSSTLQAVTAAGCFIATCGEWSGEFEMTKFWMGFGMKVGALRGMESCEKRSREIGKEIES